MDMLSKDTVIILHNYKYSIVGYNHEQGELAACFWEDDPNKENGNGHGAAAAAAAAVEPIELEQDVIPRRSVLCLIVEKTTWKLPENRTILAESYTSTVTDYQGKGNDTNTPPSTGHFVARKHANSDPQTSHNNEEIGYVLMERAHDSASGIECEAAVTTLSAKCWIADTDGYPQQYDVPFLSPPKVAVMAMAMMIGSQGAWAVLAGSPRNSATHIYVTVDEDLVP
eukprot:scaffold212316_cov71-Attheya_sp.AAC.1